MNEPKNPWSWPTTWQSNDVRLLAWASVPLLLRAAAVEEPYGLKVELGPFIKAAKEANCADLDKFSRTMTLLVDLFGKIIAMMTNTIMGGKAIGLDRIRGMPEWAMVLESLQSDRTDSIKRNLDTLREHPDESICATACKLTALLTYVICEERDLRDRAQALSDLIG